MVLAGRGEDVVVGQRVVAVDADIEDALAGAGRVGVGEMEPDLIGAPWSEFGDDIAEAIAGSAVLIDRLRGGVEDAGGADGVDGGERTAAVEVGVGQVTAARGASRRDRYPRAGQLDRRRVVSPLSVGVRPDDIEAPRTIADERAVGGEAVPPVDRGVHGSEAWDRGVGRHRSGEGGARGGHERLGMEEWRGDDRVGPAQRPRRAVVAVLDAHDHGVRARSGVHMGSENREVAVGKGRDIAERGATVSPGDPGHRLRCVGDVRVVKGRDFGIGRDSGQSQESERLDGQRGRPDGDVAVIILRSTELVSHQAVDRVSAGVREGERGRGIGRTDDVAGVGERAVVVEVEGILDDRRVDRATERNDRW